MNKSQLVGAVSESTQLVRRTVQDVADALLSTIVAEVRSGRKVTVVGFGTFNPTTRAARVGRNPRTGSAVSIPASKGVRFGTGSAFKSALNSKEGAPMAVKKAPARKAVATKAPARKATAKKAPARKAVATKAPARKTVVKKAPARKTAAKKAPARKTVATKAPARKTVAKKAPARKTVAKKAPARKTAAKKAPARRAR